MERTEGNTGIREGKEDVGQKELFVSSDSIVRTIWGSADTVLFIFAGASAEFALNKAVDWLYFTGKLPADPLGRLFSTVNYARQIVFSDRDAAHKAIDQIAAIHTAVENKRGAKIPDWAYRDVLFLLIDYSIRAFEVLQHPLTFPEKEEIATVFLRVGTRMGIPGLPQNFDQWVLARTAHLQADLLNGHFTKDLFLQYRKHLGGFRYLLLRQVQAAVAPATVSQLLNLGKNAFGTSALALYKWTRATGIGKEIRNSLLPEKYREQVMEIDGTAASFS